MRTLWLLGLCLGMLTWPAGAATDPCLGVGEVSLAVSATNLAPASVNANLFTSLLKLRVKAVNGTVTVTGLTLQDIGTAPGAGLAVQVLFGGKKMTATATYDQPTKTWQVTFAMPRVLTAGQYIYLELQEQAPQGAVGSTVGLAVNAVQCGVPVTGGLPLRSNLANVAATPFVAASGYSVAPASVAPGVWTALYKLRLEAKNGSVTVQGVKVRQTGTAAATSLGVRVAKGGTPVAALDSVDPTNKTWTLLFTNPLTLAAGAYNYLDLQILAAPDAGGKTVQTRVLDQTYIVSPQPVGGTWPLDSAAAPVAAVPYVAASATNLAPATTAPGNWTAMLKLRLGAVNGAASITGLKLTDHGGANVANLAVRVLRGGSELPATKTFDTPTRTWTVAFNTPIALAAGAYNYLDLQERLASDGGTMQLWLNDPQAVLASQPAAGLFPLASGVTAVGDQVNWNDYNASHTGDTWWYQVDGNRRIDTVLGQMTLGGRSGYTVEKRTGPTAVIEYFTADAATNGYFGIDRAAEITRYDPPFLWPAETVIGSVWTGAADEMVNGVKTGTVTIETTLESRGSATVPAGAFNDCVVTLSRATTASGTRVWRAWFARGVGEVKREDEAGNVTKVLQWANINGVQYGIPPNPVQSARLTFTNVDSGGGTGTLDMTKQGSETRYTSFSAAPPDFAGAGCPTLIPANVSVGTKWSSSGISNGMNFTTDGEVQSVTDTVTVPAGTFTGCLRIYDVNTYADLATYIAQGGYGTIDRTRWFAPGVGLVKYASTVAKANGNEVITAPLVSYQLAGTPGATDWWPLALGSQWVYQESHMGTPTAWTVSTYTTQQ